MKKSQELARVDDVIEYLQETDLIPFNKLDRGQKEAIYPFLTPYLPTFAYLT